MIEKCIICNQREADFEGVICWECKRRQDEIDMEEEQKAFESDMLEYNHRGEFCWLTGKTFCQEGWCEQCSIYKEWKSDLRRAVR